MRTLCLSILLLSAAGCGGLPPFRDLPAPTAENVLTGGLLFGRVEVTLDGKHLALDAEGRVAYVVIRPVRLHHLIDPSAAAAPRKPSKLILRCLVDPAPGAFMLSLPPVPGIENPLSTFKVTGVSLGLTDTRRKNRAPVTLINFPLDDEIPVSLQPGFAAHSGVIQIGLRSREKTEATEDSQRLLESELISVRVFPADPGELLGAIDLLRWKFPGLDVESANSPRKAAVTVKSVDIAP
jgi:hypothetical protein